VAEGGSKARWWGGSAPAPAATVDPDGPSTADGRIDLGDIRLDDDRAATRYSDWAERLRAKRERDQAHIRGTDADPGPASHWSADALRDAGAGDPWASGAEPDGADRVAAFGVLGLTPQATEDEVALAYRRLAKAHHPDRYAAAPADVQAEHAEAMLRINAAYGVVRRTRA
jgi:DnaJ-domain-containing protein 1